MTPTARSWRAPSRRVGAVAASAALLAPFSVTAVADSAQAAGFRPASNGARIVNFKWIQRGSMFDFTIRSNALGGRYQVRVLVPRTWRSNSRRTWPTLYAYHGGRDRYISWTRSTNIEGFARRFDVMVVMPAGDNGSYTNWWNGGRGGRPRWEAFHNVEVRELVERNFHAGGSRACMGNSSGGQGCITYAARHPGMFRYAASYSGVLSMLSPGIPALLLYTMAGDPKVNPLAIYGDPVFARANWVAHDPTSLAGRLRGTRLYFSSGTTGMPGPFERPGIPPWDIGLVSERGVGYSNTVFRDRLRQLRVPFTAHIYGNGRHSWPYWIREMKTTWPTIMATIGARRF